MKKVLLFLAIATMLAACSGEELTDQSTTLESSLANAVNFSIYTQRATRAGYGTEITTDVLKNGDFGFGVFGFYSNNDDYSQFLQPNFMYNQQVKWDGSNWTYEPVKYWPNEYGNAAESDDVDKVTFFAYAPWVEVNPSTGVPVGTPATEYEKALLQSKNITSVNKNTAIGDPIIKYVVDTDPKTSVDLLWGVVPMGGQEPSTTNYTDITGSTSLTGGWPYMNLIKEQAASNGKVNFNFMHATAKLNVQIDADVDEATISGGHSKEVDAKTRIYVRSVSFTGFAMKGALNLNNSDVVAGMPNWLDFDSSKELSFDGVTFYDGRKDGKEATKNGAQDNERPAGLNPRITQDENCTSTDGKTWDSQANAGVTHAPVFLWGSWNTNALVDPANADSYIYVIPQQNEPVTVTIVYDVETIDPNLPGYLSDGITHGSTIENTITSSNIFGASVGIESGKSYVIKMHLGMTSVKFDASVVPWANGGATTPVFPANM